MIEIKQYNLDDAVKWNEFVSISKQGTFLFNRNYMDYHADRFADCSFLIMEKGHIVAVLPANRKAIPYIRIMDLLMEDYSLQRKLLLRRYATSFLN